MCSCVLVVEHDAYVRQAIGRGLRQAGFQVMLLSDADEAIDLLCLVAFDLVLADVGTLRYCSGPASGLTALMQVVRSAPLQCFTTPATMGAASQVGMLLLDPPPHDVTVLVAAVREQLAPGPARMQA